MVEIGKFLKENRIKQKKSIDDISNITKMNINIIKNIESGNVAYFSNDLTYLRYYVRAYANAINVDFNSLDESLQSAILSYTQSIDVLEQEKIEQLNKQIKTKQKKISPNISNLNKAKRIDWTLVSLISIVVLIVVFLAYSITINLMKERDPIEKPPIVDTDKDNDKDKDDDPLEEPDDEIIEEIKVDIKAENANTYMLSDFSDDLEIKTKFNVNTWVQIQVNGVVINIPNETFLSKTFLAGEELIIPINYVVNNEEKTLAEGDIISIRYGIMQSNEFFVNDEILELDEQIKNALGGTDLIFKLEKKLQQ